MAIYLYYTDKVSSYIIYQLLKISVHYYCFVIGRNHGCATILCHLYPTLKWQSVNHQHCISELVLQVTIALQLQNLPCSTPVLTGPTTMGQAVSHSLCVSCVQPASTAPSPALLTLQGCVMEAGTARWVPGPVGLHRSGTSLHLGVTALHSPQVGTLYWV